MRPAAGAKPCAASDADLPLQWAPMSGGGGWDAVVIFDAQQGAPSVSKIEVELPQVHHAAAYNNGAGQHCIGDMPVWLSIAALRLPLFTR